MTQQIYFKKTPKKTSKQTKGIAHEMSKKGTKDTLKNKHERKVK